MVDGEYMLDYFKNQKEFIENLQKEVYQKLIVRLHPLDFEWDNKLF